MLDPIAAYRSSQVMTASPAGTIVLLYQGAIRQAVLHLDALERHDPEAANRASLRAQDIVEALTESLDLSAGPIAEHLASLYLFVHDRLVAGNVAKEAQPTREALQVLRDLLPAWQEIARLPIASIAPASVRPVALRSAVAPAG